MNIFFLDRNPVKAAQYQCNKHVVKMILETDELLRLTNCAHPKITGKYRYINHPCRKWVSESAENYRWLYKHLRALLWEYKYRYEKEHKYEKLSKRLRVGPKLPEVGLTQPYLAMPLVYKQLDAVQSYRNYYIGEKAYFCKWKKDRRPSWWPYVDEDNTILRPNYRIDNLCVGQ